MDKILLGMDPTRNNLIVTNDGATILRSIPVDNPAAKILINVSKTQDEEVGDGTTSVAVLTGELLHEAERLMNLKIHPQTIISGWRKAVKVARQALEDSSRDNSGDEAKFREDLVNIAKTTLSSKILNVDPVFFSEIAVDAVLRLKGSTDLDSIQIIKKVGGSLNDSFLADGFILDKRFGIGQKTRIEDAKILVANTPMDTDKIKIYAASVRVDSMDKVANIEKAERKRMKSKVKKILNHGMDIFINRQLIYDYPEQLFSDAKVNSIEHADFEGIERLALVTGAEICSTFDHPEMVRMGHADLVEEIVIGEDRVIKFSGVPKGEACTIVLRGASPQILDEAERSMHDALCVLSQTTKETRTVLGGGCSEMLMSNAVDDLAKRTPGKQALAVEGFANALRSIPTILSDNAGLDSSELVTQLRAAHYKGNSTAGVDVVTGAVGDMVDLAITESFKCKMQVLISAHEAAEMILRVDEIIKAAPRQREQH
jgi:T-complex protein 1 subunit beta